MANVTSRERTRIPTLIDPFELAAPLPVPLKGDVAATLFEVDVQLEEDAAKEWEERPSVPPPAESSRLRCWCSEEDE
jgi:hypothetical protein